MSPAQRSYDEAELEAYVDGELDAVRSAELAAWLSGRPNAQAAAETIRYQNAGLHALFDGLLQQPVPPRLRAALRKERKGGRLFARLRLPWYGWAVGCMLLAVASAAVGWTVHSYSEQQRAQERRMQAFLDQIQSTYTLYAMTDRQDVIDEARLNSILNTITQRLNAEIRRPQPYDDYRLLDGRLIPTAGSVAAVFFFSDPEGQRISLYVQRSWEPRLVDAQLVHRDDLSFYYWTDGPLTYALAAPVREGYLRDLGARLYPQPH